MATLYTEQSKNAHKTWLLMSLFFVIIIALGYIFSYVYNAPQILYFAVFFSIAMNVFSYWYSDKIVISLSGAREISKEENKELWNVVENLTIIAGLPMPRIYVVDDLAPNAFATGRDKNHAVIAVTTGLLSLLNRSELEGVIAHELSHIGNRDILISTVVVVLVGFIALLSDLFLRMGFFGAGRKDDNNRGGGIIVLIGIILAILSPIAATLIHLSISRKREFLADASGALLTRYPEGLANALKKISEYNQPMQRANNAIAHLYISNPFGKQKNVISVFQKMFLTHPPIEERVEALLGRYE